MSWIAVNFSLIKFSDIEGTYYFYDPNYPTAIQFLLNGRWEPWDVGYVRTHAHDPDVKRVAEDGEARLNHDSSFGYSHWPPPSEIDAQASSNAHAHASPTSPRTVSLQSNGEAPSSSHQHQAQARHKRSVDGQVLRPSLPQQQPPNEAPSAIPQSSNSLQSNGRPFPGVPAPTYASPYAARPVPPPINTNQSPVRPPEQPWQRPESTFTDTPVSPLPYHASTRENKILLSLDGDGVRGLSTVLLVESFVNAVCSKLGRCVDPYQIFDLIGGVSTTGFFAVMIGRMRMRAHSAREAYLGLSEEIFQDKRDFFQTQDPHKPAPPQPPISSLERSTQELVSKVCENPDAMFFDNRNDSTNVFVVSTKINIGSTQPAILRSYPSRRLVGPDVDTKLTVWQAIRATLGAPRYLNQASQEGQRRKGLLEPGLVDYGVAKNNPVRDVYFESKRLYSYADDKMILISIGTGSGLDETREIPEMAKSVTERTSEADLAHYRWEGDHRAEIDGQWVRYFRFNVPNLETVPLEEWSSIDKIMEKTHAYLGDAEVGNKFYECVDAVTAVLAGEQTQRASNVYLAQYE
ncbi:FabD/lysophospholipase-like protein [Lophiostoma macrostomum CBS 122681]|uniref:FabD/lysophospholipase-like protein n=1 Tax=Lophiostoma macrostomum CBS 122681 TaxID=1314788 RepID=A0A6A6TIN4_9PLEO|nr:FabD/lysophospholipase-like protein [Lophiostoma macrostomum CBS 122681]